MVGRLAPPSALRHPQMRQPFVGYVLSNLGDWLNLVALLNLLLYECDQGPPALGTVLTAMALPAAQPMLWLPGTQSAGARAAMLGSSFTALGVGYVAAGLAVTSVPSISKRHRGFVGLT
jgi:hypothetical protein